MNSALRRVEVSPMSDVTRILSRLESGDPTAAEHLLPLVYAELRKLAAARMAMEKPGQTLQATALVHEAFLRLVVEGRGGRAWDNRGHFFAASAEAMRRILVENARRKLRQKHGGGQLRVDLGESDLATNLPADEMLLLDEAIEELAAHDRTAADLVKLQYFAGLSVEEAAKSLGVPRTTAYRHWTYARAWLVARVHGTR